jgi:integrase|tara:strand:+ start:89 stop:370 length:282 start_codon:yes stop_codon:yes gene_type:complete
MLMFTGRREQETLKLKWSDVNFEKGTITMPNGNSVMLMDLTRLGFKNEAKELANSLNGYLNIYKTFMISSVKSIDYLNQIESNKKCNHEGCSV